MTYSLVKNELEASCENLHNEELSNKLWSLCVYCYSTEDKVRGVTNSSQRTWRGNLRGLVEEDREGRRLFGSPRKRCDFNISSRTKKKYSVTL